MNSEFPKQLEEKRILYLTCSECGFRWPLGTNGTHSCGEVLRKELAEAYRAIRDLASKRHPHEAPMSSKVLDRIVEKSVKCSL